MDTSISLADAHDKLRWAKYHFEILRSQIEPFEQRDSHSISVEVNADTGEYVFHVHGLEVTDPDWGLMIGDCLHNARTALDYVMVRLVAMVTGQDPADVGDVQFPIYDDPKKFASRTGGLAKEPAFSGYLTPIEELQPFNAFNPSVWGTYDSRIKAGLRDPSLPYALDRLSALDNIDKHRIVHATWLGTRFGGYLRISDDAPDGFRPIGGGTTLDPLEDGAQVGQYTFEAPLPSEWAPTEMQMKGYFPLQVSFPDPSPVKGVLEILPWCLSGVEAVLAIFAPVFDEGKPPLPVTAVKTVRG